MNVFEEIKARADILKVCDVAGIKLNRNNMSICPFPDHKEKTPSFSVLPSKNIFYCFGCGKKGDVITLIQELFNMQPLDAADYINTHLGLGVDFKNKEKGHYEALIHRYEKIRQSRKVLENKKNKMFQKLCDLLHYLDNKRKNMNPFTDEYVTISNDLNLIEYYLDFFTEGTDEEMEWIVKTKEKEVAKIEQGRR